MKSNVTFIELTSYEKITPLVSGYLQSYASKDINVRDSFNFQIYSSSVRMPLQRILEELRKHDSLVYAFSCYMWNMGLVSYLLQSLLEDKKESYFILGGPQVIGSANKYLNSRYENAVICNGEGEKTFSNFLKELTNTHPNFSNIRGLSFFRDKELITTENEEQIMDLDEIPSPFLNNLFPKGLYAYTIFETNRGCPYKCAYCFWGSVKQKISKFSNDRIKEELTWISKNMILGIFIGDANWGILKRDLDFSKLIAENKKYYGYPYIAIVNSSKNNTDRLAEIAKIFQDSGMMSSHSIPLQTLNQNALKNVNRDNISTEGYEKLQGNLNEKKISSFVELIWPLPGETLSSFREGINKLCCAKVECIFPYPLSLLNNTELSKRQNEFGIVTKRMSLGGGENDLVTETKDVNNYDYQEGLWLSFALILLYNARGLYFVGNYLNKKKRVSFAGLFATFADFCKKNRQLPFVEYHEKSVGELSHYQFEYVGKIIHIILHSYRDEFDELLFRYCSQYDWWNEDNVHALFEMDLLNRPYAYSTSPLTKKYQFEHLRIISVFRDGYIVDIPDQYQRFIKEYQEIYEDEKKSGTLFKIKCMRNQLPFMKGKNMDENASYCHSLMINVRNIIPVWSKN